MTARLWIVGVTLGLAISMAAFWAGADAHAPTRALGIAELALGALAVLAAGAHGVTVLRLRRRLRRYTRAENAPSAHRG